MQIVTSTPIALLLTLIIALLGPFRGLWVLFALVPMGMMAALNLPAVGGTSILAVDLAVLCLFTMLILRHDAVATFARLLHPNSPGLPLLGFTLFASAATMFLPRIFAGETDVFGIGRIANATGIVIRPLGPSNGNLSQILRLGLSTMVFAVVAFVTLRRPDPVLLLGWVKILTAVHVGMGLIDIFTNVAGLAFLLDWARTANYALTLGHQMAGLNRMIGGFPEASAYSYVSLGLLGFWLSYWFTSPSREQHTALLTCLVIFVVLRGTSSSGYVAGMALVIVFTAVNVFSIRGAWVGRRAAAITICAIALVPPVLIGCYALYEMVPGVQSFVDRSLINKLDTESGVERMSWNRQALINFVDTNLFGAGLGSVRASNWFISTLATTGAIGTFLALIFLLQLFLLPLPRAVPERRLATAAKFACAGLLLRALVVKASPNLEFTFFVFAGLATGLCIGWFPKRGNSAA